MKIFAQNQRRPQQESSTNLTRSNAVVAAATHQASSILHPRRTIGNQAVSRLPGAEAEGLDIAAHPAATTHFAHDFSRIPLHAPPPITIQPKLTINTPGDVYEQEADHVAEQVMRMSEPNRQGGCACGGGCSTCQSGSGGNGHLSLQTKHVGSSDSGQITAPPIVHEELASPGQPLDASTRAFFEPRFGQDFSGVRVHTDSQSGQSAQALQARAYTVGRDIVFGSGCYAPASAKGRALIAHELVHVTQQTAGAYFLARQTTEQYETKGVKIDPADLNALARLSYWEQKIRSVFHLSPDPAMTARFANAEERDAVLSVAWQMRPQTAITQEITNVVKIPKRSSVRTSQDLAYQITFTPRRTPNDHDIVAILFVSEGTGATAVAPDPPSTSFKRSVSYTPGGFPQNAADRYWQGHREEERRVFSWIETRAPSGKFNQVITTTSGSGSSTQKASFEVSGTKEPSGRIPDLTVVFLGAVGPSTKAAVVGSHDFADEGIEEAQTTLDPRTQDKLGTIKWQAGQPQAEMASAKFAIWQYFKNGTRNAEVDAIIPIADPRATRPRRVLYTFIFKPTTNDVDVQRIGEEGKDVNLAPQGSLGQVNGYVEHTKDGSVKTLTDWLKKRYKGITPVGSTIEDIEKDVTAKIRAGSDDPDWFDKNYGIKILDATKARTWLVDKLGHNKPEELRDLSRFSKTELQLLEVVLEKMNDEIVKTFKGLQMIRQKVYNEFLGPPHHPAPGHFEERPLVGGITILPGTTRTTIIFDQASANADSLFLGGIGPDGKPAVEMHTGLAVAHELGHTIADRRGVQAAFDHLVVTKQIKPITWYAASDPPKELFPESFGLYYSDPKWLKENWLDLYNFFDTLDKTGKPPPTP